MPTRRHTLYGQCLILLIAGCAWGQWNTNVWPAYEHPREGRQQATDCYWALIERAQALGRPTNSAAITYPSFYRFQRTLCDNYKSWIYEQSRSFSAPEYQYWFVDPRCVTNGSILGWLNGATNDSSRKVGIVDSQTLGEICRIPTNFLTFTPYRGLDGIGPFTNDTTVPRPHGWTNAYTAAGGTNFGGSRTNWYTTDYGWDNLRAAITNLRYRVNYNEMLGKQMSSNYLGGALGDLGDALADVKATAEAAYDLEGTFGYNYYTMSFVQNVNYYPPLQDQWSVYLENAGNISTLKTPTRMTTNVASSVEGYVLTYVPDAFGSVFGDVSGQWSQQGSFFNTTNGAYGWNVTTNTAWTNADLRAEYGYTNAPAWPTFTPTNGDQSVQGIQWGETIFFGDYNTGFQYK